MWHKGATQSPPGPDSCPSGMVSPFSVKAMWSSLVWLPLPGLGLNSSACLPLQPHFQPLPQYVTPANIPVFFPLYWADSKSWQVWPHGIEPIISKLSCAGTVTRGSCLPVTSWVEVNSTPQLKAWPQLFHISMKPVKGYRCVK